MPRKKLHRISFLASNKVNAGGHKLRHEIYQKFQYRLPTFGSIVTGFHENKLYALAAYRFSVVVEGERNAGCFSDHLLDCLALKTVPLYWGCPDIGRWFNPEGILSFKTLDDLEHLLTDLPPVRQDVIDENAELARCYRVPEDWLWENCRDLFEGLE